MKTRARELMKHMEQMNRKVFMNMETGEITFDHDKAVKEFFNNGCDVLVYLERDPRHSLKWMH